MKTRTGRGISVSLSGLLAVFTLIAGTAAGAGTVPAQAAPYDDCGDTAASACTPWSGMYQLVGTSSATGLIGTPGDVDWFKITPPTSDVWTFTSQPWGNEPLADPAATLYAPDGATVLASNDNVSPETNNLQFQVSAQLTAGQTYYLEIKGQPDQTGGYQYYANPSTVKPFFASAGPWTAAPWFRTTATVQIISSEAWRITYLPPWVTASASSGSGNSSLTLRADSNDSGLERTGSVTFVSDTRSSILTIKQSYPDDCGVEISSSCTWGDTSQPKTGTLETAGDVDMWRFTPPTTGYWMFTSDWLFSKQSVSHLDVTIYNPGMQQIAHAAGYNGPITFQIGAQLEAGLRYFITIKSTSIIPGYYKFTAAATQLLELSQTTWRAPAQGGTLDLQLNSGAPWSVTAQPDWVHLSQSSGTGSAALTLAVDPYTGPTVLTELVTFANGSATVTLAITRYPPPTSMSPTTWSPVWWGASVPLQITGTSSWRLYLPWWMNANVTSGTGSATVWLSANPFFDNGNRNGTVYLMTSTEILTMKVTQSGW